MSCPTSVYMNNSETVSDARRVSLHSNSVIKTERLEFQFRQGQTKKMKLKFDQLSYQWFYFLLVLLLVNLSTVSSDSVDTRAVDNVNQDTVSKIDKNATPEPNSNEKGKGVTVAASDINVNTSVSAKDIEHVNCSLPENVKVNKCKENDDGVVSDLLKKMSSNINSGMLFRTMYVLLAMTGIVIVYFIVKALRLRRRRSKSRKYGIITKQGDHGDMEMEPLGDGMDEDDDYTVFEMGRRK